MDEKEGAEVLENATRSMPDTCVFTVVSDNFLAVESTENCSYDLIMTKEDSTYFSILDMMGMLRHLGIDIPMIMTCSPDHVLTEKHNVAKSVYLLNYPFTTAELCNSITQALNRSEIDSEKNLGRLHFFADIPFNGPDLLNISMDQLEILPDDANNSTGCGGKSKTLPSSIDSIDSSSNESMLDEPPRQKKRRKNAKENKEKRPVGRPRKVLPGKVQGIQANQRDDQRSDQRNVLPSFATQGFRFAYTLGDTENCEKGNTFGNEGSYQDSYQDSSYQNSSYQDSRGEMICHDELAYAASLTPAPIPTLFKLGLSDSRPSSTLMFYQTDNSISHKHTHNTTQSPTEGDLMSLMGLNENTKAFDFFGDDDDVHHNRSYELQSPHRVGIGRSPRGNVYSSLAASFTASPFLRTSSFCYDSITGP